MEMIQDDISTAIIETARKLAKTKSIDKITVRDLLKEMNTTNRVFYNRFHSIDDVLNILYRETIDIVRKSVFRPYDGQEDFAAYVTQIAHRTLLLSYESRKDMSQFIFQMDSRSDDNFAWWREEILKLIVKGKELKVFRQELDDEAVTYAIWCFIRGFNTDALTRQLPMEEASRLFLHGFGCFLEGARA